MSVDEQKNVIGIDQYKRVMYAQYKYLYQKYGKYLYQLHPLDIITRSDSLRMDMRFNQDIVQLFGVKDITKDDFDNYKKAFEDNLEENPVLKLIFPESDRDRDLFFLKLVVYYNYAFTNIQLIVTTGRDEINSQNAIQFRKYYMDSYFKKDSVGQLLALEKDIEEEAKKYGFGEMNGLSEAEKQVYLFNLYRRGLAEDYNLNERLSATKQS